jgi:PhnB protein
MRILNPYLYLPGNTEEAFIFYKSVFGGEFIMLLRYKDTPEADRVSDEEKEKIMHIALPIGNGNTLMATDAIESMGNKLNNGNNFNLSFSTDTPEEADRIYNELSAGGKSNMPMSKTFWGAWFGMLTDKFGIQWMISYDQNQQ